MNILTQIKYKVKLPKFEFIPEAKVVLMFNRIKYN